MQPGQPSSLPGRTKLQATTAMHMMFSSTCTQVRREMSTIVSIISGSLGGISGVYHRYIIRHTNQFEWGQYTGRYTM